MYGNNTPIRESPPVCGVAHRSYLQANRNAVFLRETAAGWVRDPSMSAPLPQAACHSPCPASLTLAGRVHMPRR